VLKVLELEESKPPAELVTLVIPVSVVDPVVVVVPVLNVLDVVP